MRNEETEPSPNPNQFDFKQHRRADRLAPIYVAESSDSHGVINDWPRDRFPSNHPASWTNNLGVRFTF
jgi:hypothetical protein